MRPADLPKLAELAEPLRSRVAAILTQGRDRIWIVSGLRSRTEQIALRRQNCGTTFYAIYQQPASECDPPTARPGSSKHEKGLAVDLGGDLALAKVLGAQAGTHTPVRGEDWHHEVDPAATSFVTGTDIPGAVEDAAGDVLGGLFGGAEDAVASVLGKLIDPLVSGLRRVTIVAALVTGGVVLVILGGLKGTGADSLVSGIAGLKRGTT